MNIESSSSEQSLPDKKGYLVKQGGVIKNWRKRWFVLHGNNLLYYKAKGDKEHAGSIILSEDCGIQDALVKTGKKHSIEVKTPTRSYFLYSEESKQDIDEWTTALKKATISQKKISGINGSKGRILALQVRGMLCPCCSENVEKALGKMKGVTGTNIDLSREIVYVHGKVEKIAVMNCLEDAGFLPAEL